MLILFCYRSGPLLYHFADLLNEQSIELTYEELKEVIKKVGFTIREERENLPATYTENASSMLQYQYNCVFFVAQKPEVPDTTSTSGENEEQVRDTSSDTKRDSLNRNDADAMT